MDKSIHWPITVTTTSQCLRTDAAQPYSCLSGGTTEVKAGNTSSLDVLSPDARIAASCFSPGAHIQLFLMDPKLLPIKGTPRGNRSWNKCEKNIRKANQWNLVKHNILIQRWSSKKPKTWDTKGLCPEVSITPILWTKIMYNGVHQSAVIRCSTCMQWYHTTGVGEELDYVAVFVFSSIHLISFFSRTLVHNCPHGSHFDSLPRTILINMWRRDICNLFQTNTDRKRAYDQPWLDVTVFSLFDFLKKISFVFGSTVTFPHNYIGSN